MPDNNMRREPMSVEEITERLDRLRDHQFIGSWRRERSRWYVECVVTWGPYNAREVAAFVEGCNAMGAAP